VSLTLEDTAVNRALVKVVLAKMEVSIAGRAVSSAEMALASARGHYNDKKKSLHDAERELERAPSWGASRLDPH